MSRIQETLLLHIIRLVWILIVLPSVGLWIASIISQYSIYQLPCLPNECLDTAQLTQTEAEELRTFGYPVSSYASFVTFMQSLKGLSFVALGILLFWKKFNDKFNPFASMIIVGYGISMESVGFIQGSPVVEALVYWIEFASASIILLLLVFPDGKVVPKWSLFIAAFWLLTTFCNVFMPGSMIDPTTWPLWLATSYSMGIYTACFYAQIYRYRNVSDEVQRQQAKWFLVALALVILFSFNWLHLANNPNGVYLKIIWILIETAIVLAIPLALAIAFLKYKLWEIDPHFNRIAVYFLLSGIVAMIYSSIIRMFEIVSKTQGSFLISFIASCIIALLFQLIREKLQFLVNRLMYGQSHSPYAALSMLGQKLEASVAPQTVLPSVVETIGQVLKLPYVAIYLQSGGALNLAATYGTISTRQLNLNLTYHNEKVGELILGLRSYHEEFSQHEYRLIQDIARHVGLATYSVRLTTELIKSKENLVKAREEEKRRIRRDLHDGLGPQLATLSMNIEAARNLYKKNLHGADELLAVARNQAQNAIIEIRQLVYALRPPILDELGLRFAIQELILQNNSSAIKIHLVCADPIPMLPAAVEVAAYRIVQESIANVIQHSEASDCTVTVEFNDKLQVEIQDNGKGISPTAKKGIGTFSMRERAEELGGNFQIFSEPGKGTRVQTIIPLTYKE